MKTNQLWTKNFKILIIGMFLSAIGGVGLNIALGLVVFDQTQSTLLSGLFVALSTIPSLVLPLVVGPYIDRKHPLKVLLKNETILLFVYLSCGILIQWNGFSYGLYLTLTLLISCLSIISQLASESIVPQVIQPDNYPRGYAVISMIYPLCSVLVTPVALYIYQHYGISMLFYIYTALSLLDILLERNITTEFSFINEGVLTAKQMGKDLMEGFRYLKADRALVSVFLFFVLVMIANGYSVIVYPFFDASPVLTAQNYAWMMSVSSAGYLCGGILHYFIEIKAANRFRVALVVYLIFVFLDGVFFFVPFMWMCGIRFVLGILGINSANIRTSAVQGRVKANYRAKVNGFFSILMAISTIVGQLLVGMLGEVLPYAWIMVLLQGIYLFGILWFIVPKRNKVRELYTDPLGNA